MTAEIATGAAAVLDDKKIFYNRFLLIVAGLGGLLYGVDVGIIAGALPYLEATSTLSRGQLSIVVAAVLLGSVISTLFAGLLADWMGRKSLMALSGVMFVISIPMIALSQGYGAAGLWAAAARRERGLHWSRRPAISGRVPAGIESRQRHGNFPVAVDRRNRGGGHRRRSITVSASRKLPSSATQQCFSTLKMKSGAEFSGSRCRPASCS